MTLAMCLDPAKAYKKPNPNPEFAPKSRAAACQRRQIMPRSLSRQPCRFVQRILIDHLRRRYGKIDYAFIGYGIASGFPNSHFVPGKNNAKSAEKRQHHFNGVWSSLMAGINPKYGLPFAADVVLLDENLIWANEPVRNRERPTDRFRLDHPESSTQVVDIAPGFTVIDGRITKEVVFEPVHLETLRAEMAAEIRKANEARAASVPQVQELAALIEHNVQLCQAYLTRIPQMEWRSTSSACQFL